MSFSDGGLYEFEGVVLALLAGAYALFVLVRALTRTLPGLAIGGAVAAAFAVRILASVGVDQIPGAQTLRGGDELGFMEQAHELAGQGIGSSASLTALTDRFHVFVLSLPSRLLDPVSELTLRLVMITLAVAGLALLAAAVYELAGPKPALIAAWLLALEPANVFFSSILHKEPLMFLAEGLVAFGGARLWKRGDLGALVPMVLGCLIATATRPYVGWFLAAAAAAVALHASLRRNSASGSLLLAAVVAALIGAFVPVVWNASSEEKLEELQGSQEANAENESANLSLEKVDYSTREKVILNLPKRIRDIVLRPYPWQLENTSQRLGLLGTLVLFVGLILLVGALVRNGRAIMARAGPLVYPALFLLMAYALSAGNAGTAFRYRTHLVGLILCLLVVMRQQRAEERAALAPQPSPGLRPLPAGGPVT